MMSALSLKSKITTLEMLTPDLIFNLVFTLKGTDVELF